MGPDDFNATGATPPAGAPGKVLDQAAPPARPPWEPEPRVGPWYRQPRWWAIGAVVAGLAAAVIVDIPRPATHAQRASDLQSFLAEAEGDVASCNAGLHDALVGYRTAVPATATARQRSIAVGLIQDGLSACSFTNQSIDDLAGMQAPRSLASLHLRPLSSALLSWADPSAGAACTDMLDVLQHRGTTAAAADLSRRAAELNQTRARSEKLLASVQHAIGSHLAPLPMAIVSIPAAPAA
ncbi:MAG: hypothetical protein ACRDYD_13190 [Acidimicrobiales bacterium]